MSCVVRISVRVYTYYLQNVPSLCHARKKDIYAVPRENKSEREKGSFEILLYYLYTKKRIFSYYE